MPTLAKTPTFPTLPMCFAAIFAKMKLRDFFKSGGLIRLSKGFYVSVFCVIAVIFAFICDFSLYTLLLFLSILVHELTHVVCLKLCGGRIIKTVVFPFGIDMVCDTSNLSFFKELLCVTSAGAVNLVMSCVFFWVFGITRLKWAIFFCICNAAIGVANLIPHSSLDGGRGLYLLLSMFVLPDKAYAIQKYTDLVCLCVMGGAGFCFLDFCGFNLSLIAAVIYSGLCSVIFSLYKKRYI